MSDDSRIVRDLLDANRHLTDQLIELARLVIGAPVAAPAVESTYEAGGKGPVPDDPFTMRPPLDWEDIPSLPMGTVDDEEDEHVAHSLEVARRGLSVVPEEELPIYMSEEEEDMRHAVSMSLRPRSDLDDLLAKFALPGQHGENVIEFSPESS